MQETAARLNSAGAALSRPHALRHEALLGRTVKRFAFRTHRFASTGVPFALFQEAVERGASQGLAILVNRFGCARFLRHCRAERQGRNHSSKKDSFHGLSPVSEPAVYSKNCRPKCRSAMQRNAGRPTQDGRS